MNLHHSPFQSVQKKKKRSKRFMTLCLFEFDAGKEHVLINSHFSRQNKAFMQTMCQAFIKRIVDKIFNKFRRSGVHLGTEQKGQLKSHTQQRETFQNRMSCLNLTGITTRIF